MLSLRTDDCQREAERLKAKGVVFATEPWRRELRRHRPGLADSRGNLLNLHQD